MPAALLKLKKKENVKSKSERTIEDAVAATGMGTACHRTGERMMAALGQLNGATTLLIFETIITV